MLVIHVRNLVAAGKLEPCGGFFPGFYSEGLVYLGMAVDSQTHPGDEDGNPIVLQYIVGHAPLVVVLHGCVGGGQQQFCQIQPLVFIALPKVGLHLAKEFSVLMPLLEIHHEWSIAGLNSL